LGIDKLIEFCSNKVGVTEEFPFNEDTLVFKVGGKIFCLLNLVPPHTINLKCNPEKVITLIEEHEEISPGYHMNKKHWITVDLSGTLSNKLIWELVNESYDLVCLKLPEKIKKELKIR
jgi:predicted DNA-binding protein (MmcQ/YjbR family)